MWWDLYKSLDDFGGSRRSILERTLMDGEEMVAGIDCANRLLVPWDTKLVLTNRRLIAFRKKFIGSRVEDYRLGDLTSIRAESGLFRTSLLLQGAGIRDEYVTLNSLGQPFATAVREELEGE